MVSHINFTVVYDGLSLENHEIDVKTLAPALLALGEVIEETNRVLNGSSTKTTLTVKGAFKSGSFGIELICTHSILNTIIDFFNSDPVNAALNLLELVGIVGATAAGLIQILRWIKGRKLNKIVFLEKEGNVTLVIEEETLVVKKEVMTLLKNQRIRDGLAKIISTPLGIDGIDRVAFHSNNEKEGCVIEKDEASYFASPAIEDEILPSSEYDTILEVISPVFQENNKWRMSDGASTFFVEISDLEFLNKVQNSEIVFAKGDLLRLRISESKALTSKGLRIEKVVVKIYEHRSSARQLNLSIKSEHNNL